MEVRKHIRFNEDMEQDMQFIKNCFVQKYKYYPSNKQVIEILLKIGREKQLEIDKKSRQNKREFIFRI